MPIMIQNAITNFVSLLDNIMVGQIGTEQMSGVAIINQLMFVFNICIFGGVSGDADAAVEALLKESLEYNPNVTCNHHGEHHHHHEGGCGSHGCGSHCGGH